MFDSEKYISAYLTRSLSITQIKELINWINQSRENKLKFRTILQYWKNTSDNDRATMDSAYDKLSKNLFEDEHVQTRVADPVMAFDPVNRYRQRWWLSIAVSLALIFAVLFYLNFNNPPPAKEITCQIITEENPKYSYPMARKSGSIPKAG